MGGIGALVLTYNRQALLARCLDAILGQSEPPDAVIVLDNGSQDGTKDYLCRSGLLDDARVCAYRFEENAGPAAGLDALFRIAYCRRFDWLWCMDDDVIAGSDALAALKAAFARNFSRPEEVAFLVSAAVSGTGDASNVPEIDMRAEWLRCPTWADRLDDGLVKLRWATFNSILIPRSTLLGVGAICPDFYFAGEDIDFTLRATERAPGYLVGKSKVTHLRESGGVFSALTQVDPRRIRMASCYYRNNIYLRRRYYSWARMLLFVGKSGWEALMALRARTHRFRRAASILRGVLAGLWFVPRRRPIDAPPAAPVINLQAAARRAAV